MTNYATLRQQRLDADMEGFHIITAVTQAAINKKLSSIWTGGKLSSGPTGNFLGPGDILQMDPTGTTPVMQASQLAPKVQFHATSKDESVLFILNFADNGSFSWVDTSGTIQTMPIDSTWKVAFDVDLSMDILSPDPTNDQAVAQKLLDSGFLEPGNYDIMQLLVDFSTANVMNYNKPLSNLPGIDNATNLSPADQRLCLRAFRARISEYLDDVKLHDDPLFHPYTLFWIPKHKSNHTSGPHEIHPTSVEFQTCPFRATAGAVGKTGDPHNMLLYLEMTKNDPAPQQRHITFTNWVIPHSPSTGSDGTVVLSRKIFLDGWLIPELKILNKYTWVAVDTVNVFKKPGGKGSYGEYHFRTDTTRETDSFFAFSPSKTSNFQWTFGQPTSNADGDEEGHLKVFADSYVGNMVSLTPGGNTLSASGTALVRVDAAFNDGKHSKFWAERKWSIDLQFGVGHNGHLAVTAGTPNIQLPITHKDEYNIHNDSVHYTVGGTRVFNPEDYLPPGPPVAQITDSLNKIPHLFHMTRPFHATAETFTFGNSIFNNSGDLIIDLHYKP